jgi:tryptophan synthase alpha chain
MNRIAHLFDTLKQKREKALIGFVTAGDPELETSLALCRDMCRNGLDLLELGIAFSDPTADGPVIQRSSQRALQQGMTPAKVIEMVAALRRDIDTPIVLFSYYNPIFAYGVSRFYEDAVKAGADGVLIVDLPPEESGEMTDRWPSPSQLSLIRLIAPTTPDERIRAIAAKAEGFLYLVSKTGVTGSAGLQGDTVEENVRRLQQHTKLPICVGFGISTVEDVARIARQADGVVIGSAFERIIEEAVLRHEAGALPAMLAAQTSAYKAATR